MKFSITLLCLLITISCIGQKEMRYWIFGSSTDGSNMSLDFFPGNTSSPSGPVSMSNPPIGINDSNGYEGWAVVTDPITGDLRMYTDGNRVYDGAHSDITPAGGLGASSSSSQPVAICVTPTSSGLKYYIFSNRTGVDTSGNQESGSVIYRTFDGSNFSTSSSLPGSPSVHGEGMVIIPKQNSTNSFYLIARSANIYYSYSVTPTGISLADNATFGPSINNNPIVNLSYSSGKIGGSIFGVSGGVFTIDFDNNTGQFNPSSFQMRTTVSNRFYDVEFSADGSKLYASSYSPLILYQIDLATNQTNTLNNFGNLQRGGGLKLGPDGNVYHIYNGGSLNATGTIRVGRVLNADQIITSNSFSSSYEMNVITKPNSFSYGFPEFAILPDQFSNGEGDCDCCVEVKKELEEIKKLLKGIIAGKHPVKTKE